MSSFRTKAAAEVRTTARRGAMQIQAEFRAEPEAAARPSGAIRRRCPPALIPTEDELQLRLAEELEYARRMLEAMGDSLSNDPAVLVRHGVALQSIDVIGQILGHIANVIRSSDPDGRRRAHRHGRPQRPADPQQAWL